MCVERIQRFMMAIVLSLAFYFFSITSICGPVLLGFVIVMITIWAITDFCPSIWLLSKFMPKCADKYKKEESK